MDAALAKSWRNTEQLLRKAMADLPGDVPASGMVELYLHHNDDLPSDAPTRAWVDFYLDHNELGVALDVLVIAVGEASAVASQPRCKRQRT